MLLLPLCPSLSCVLLYLHLARPTFGPLFLSQAPHVPCAWWAHWRQYPVGWDPSVCPAHSLLDHRVFLPWQLLSEVCL